MSADTQTPESVLSGRKCVVTGASRGIGRTIAIDFGSAGADVAVNYRSSETKAHDVAEEIESAGQDAHVVQANVANLEEVEDMATQVREEIGGTDVLVVNAGINIDKKLENLSREDWDHVIDVNLGGAFNCAKAFQEDLVKADAGRLIFISSVIGETGNIGQANYAASKSGLFGLTRTLAKGVASTGTTVNAIAPGYTKTDMIEGVPEDVQENLLEGIPVGRFAEPEEIAEPVRFLASEGSSYITGQVLSVNGGMHV